MHLGFPEGKRTAALAPLDEANADAWEEVVIGREDLDRRWSHLTSYIGALSAADAHNEEYAREEAALALAEARGAELDRGEGDRFTEAALALTEAAALALAEARGASEGLAGGRPRRGKRRRQRAEKAF